LKDVIWTFLDCFLFALVFILSGASLPSSVVSLPLFLLNLFFLGSKPAVGAVAAVLRVHPPLAFLLKAFFFFVSLSFP